MRIVKAAEQLVCWAVALAPVCIVYVNYTRHEKTRERETRKSPTLLHINTQDCVTRWKQQQYTRNTNTSSVDMCIRWIEADPACDQWMRVRKKYKENLFFPRSVRCCLSVLVFLLNKILNFWSEAASLGLLLRVARRTVPREKSKWAFHVKQIFVCFETIYIFCSLLLPKNA